MLCQLEKCDNVKVDDNVVKSLVLRQNLLAKVFISLWKSGFANGKYFFGQIGPECTHLLSSHPHDDISAKRIM